LLEEKYMTVYCAKKIIENFGEYISKNDVDSILQSISELQKSGMDNVSIREAIQEFVGYLEADKVAQVVGEFNHARVLNENLDYVQRPEFGGDINQALGSMIWRDSTGVSGSGANVENLREAYRNSLSGGLDMAIMSRGPELLSIVKSDVLTVEILDHMEGKVVSKNPTVQYLADVFKSYTDKIYNMYNNAGIPVRYREDFLFKRMYDGEKIREMGFKKWLELTVGKLDLKKSFPVGTEKNIDEIADLFIKGAGDKEFESASVTNSLLNELVDDYKKYQKSYDPFSMEAYSKMLEKSDDIIDKRLKARSYVFKSNQDLMDYMKEVGAHDNMYGYLKSQGYTAARELAMVEVFGPNPMRGVNELVKSLNAQGADFDEQVFRTKLNYATGKIKRTLPSLKDAVNSGEWEKITATSVDKSSAITSAALLGASGITQILDMSSTATLYYMKSNRNLLMASVDILKAIPSALANRNKLSI
jgi:hypothetical protein